MGLSRNGLCPTNTQLIGFLNCYGPVTALYYPFPPVWMQVSIACVIIIFRKRGRLTCPSVHKSLVPQKVYLQGYIQWTTSKELTWFEPDLDDEVLDFVPVLQWVRLIGMGGGWVSSACGKDVICCGQSVDYGRLFLKTVATFLAK